MAINISSYLLRRECWDCAKYPSTEHRRSWVDCCLNERKNWQWLKQRDDQQVMCGPSVFNWLFSWQHKKLKRKVMDFMNVFVSLFVCFSLCDLFQNVLCVKFVSNSSWSAYYDILTAFLNNFYSLFCWYFIWKYSLHYMISMQSKQILCHFDSNIHGCF